MKPGCAPPPGQQPNAGDTGQGQLNTASSSPATTPSPTGTPATDTPEDNPAPSASPGGGFIFPTLILTFAPGVLLAWPSPADCLEHDPGNLTIQHSGSGSNELWQITDGSHILLAYKRQVEFYQWLLRAIDLSHGAFLSSHSAGNW